MAKVSFSFVREPVVQQLLAAFAGEKDSIRFVGGCVRDALLERPVSDMDLATSLPPDKTSALLKAAGIHAIPTGIAHGTVTAVIDKKSFEITTLRHDVTTDGRHAEVAFTTDWKEDAARRDFTMNALYLTPEGELFDYFGGALDAKAGRIRFIGDAATRIREDYLRILRFFRFYAWYGDEAPDAAALAACKNAVSHINELSGERIQQEMLKLLRAPDPVKGLSLLQETGIDKEIFGGAIDAKILYNIASLEHSSTAPLGLAARLALLLITLPNATAALQVISGRWKLSNQLARDVATLLQALNNIDKKSGEAAQKKLLRTLGAESFTQAVLAKAQQQQDVAGYQPLLTLAASWAIPSFPVNGKDLQAIGLEEGKPMGELLNRLEMLWEESGYALTKEELLKKAR